MTPPRQRRPQRVLHYEEELWGRGVSRIAGVDEVGRGPLAGPVVACAVILPMGTLIRGARDSKHLKRATRERLAGRIWDRCARVSLGAASVREIDRLNILQATTLAMRRALNGLGETPEHVVVDGRPVRGLGVEHDAVVGGDDLIHSISCASIVAKVLRDDLMRRLALRYPHFSWETNSGYGTAAHMRALQEHGPTPHHRRSFMKQQGELAL